MRKNKKGQIAQVALIIVAVVAVLIGAIGYTNWKTGATPLATGGGPSKPGAYSYVGANVKLDLVSSNKYTGAQVNPTYYVYAQQPAGWGNARQSVASGYIRSYTATSGSATLSEQPGTYYVRGQLTAAYDEFMTVTVKASGDVPLSQYNDGGQDSKNVLFMPVANATTAAVDLGITSNTTTESTKTKYENINVPDNEGYQLSEITFTENSTYKFTVTGSNGKSAEGVKKIIVSGNGIPETVLYDNAGSIDLFGGSYKASLKLPTPAVFDENSGINLQVKVVCDATSDSIYAADQKCANGKDLMTATLIDAAGTTATFLVTG